MRKVAVGLLGLSLAATGLTVVASAAAEPQPETPPAAPTVAEPARAGQDLPNPLEVKRRALREKGLSDVLSGRAEVQRINGSTVVEVGERATRGDSRATRGGRAGRAGRGPTEKQYVEVSRERTDRIFVILAEFGNERHPDFPDQDTDPTIPGPTTFDGPLHNEIPEPDRSVDNSTVWQADHDVEHYRRLYFGTGPGDESLKQYFEAQSSGRYSVDGVVTDWVKVRYNEARYGRSSGHPCDSVVCSNVWELVRDAANQWVAEQRAAGRTDEEIAADVRAMDRWDRYDHDGDGDFNEADGYIDHFQIVHAGGDMADGDPIRGEDAIWSHRWYAYASDQGRTGPPNFRAGGTQIGDTGVWIGDYTIQPENAGRSAFYHAYAHDLGLPDDHNVSSDGDNNNEHWTLMARSRLGAVNDGGIGERGGDLGAWNKLQLGWLDYEVIVAGQQRTLTLGPQEYDTKEPQAAVVVLPEREYAFDNGAPFEGAKQFFSGNADDLSSTMTRTFDLTGTSSATLSMKGRYRIEEDYDHLFFETSVDGGRTWTTRPGRADGRPLAEISPGRFALHGSSEDEWVHIEIPLDSVTGGSVAFRLRYQTDGGVSEGGFFGDSVTLTADGETVLTDGAESDAGSDDAGWTLAGGFEVVGESHTRSFANYYIAGTRHYLSYDKYLKTGPYFFGYEDTKPDRVDRYPYQEGLMISYWNTRWAENDTSAHPGEGRNLIIDARPQPIHDLAGRPWPVGVQVYDAPFGLHKADSFTLHLDSQPQHIRGRDAQPLFDDTERYWFPELPNHGVKLPATGTRIRVLEQNGMYTKVRFS